MSNVVNIKNSIDKLDRSCLLNVGDPVDEGAQACTIPAIVRWEDGKETNAYLKCYPKAAPASLVNEVTGFLVGKECGLPLPSRMGFIDLPDEFCLKNNLLGWGVVVSELPGDTLKSIWKESGCSESVLKLLVGHLFEWSSVEQMLAFDDWVANSDRNIGNVIIRSPSDYCLIDHSYMPVRQNWCVSDLDPKFQATSVLARLHNYPYCVDEGSRSKLRQFAATHVRVYNNISNDLLHWWEEALYLAGGSEFVAERLEPLRAFIEARALNSVARVEENPTLLKAS